METISLKVADEESAEEFYDRFKGRFGNRLGFFDEDFLDDFSETDDGYEVEDKEFYPLFVDGFPEKEFKAFIVEIAKEMDVFKLIYTDESDNSSEARKIYYIKEGPKLVIKDYFSKQGLSLLWCTNCNEDIDEIEIEEFDKDKHIKCPNCNEEIEYEIDFEEETINL